MKPNIIIITSDQLRSFEVGCYGNDVIQTPNIDRLANNGVRFEYAVSCHPICMAARSAILSGQYTRRCTAGVSNFAYLTQKNGAASGILPEYPFSGRPHLKDTTLPEILKRNGYYNAAIGKWHIHSWPHDIGFDEYTIPRVHHCYTGQSFTRNGTSEFAPPGYSIDFELDEAEDFFKRMKGKTEPFFLYYNISPPHCPVSDAPSHYLNMYNPDNIPLRPNVDLQAELPNLDTWLKIYRYDFRYYELHLPYTDILPDGYGLPELIAEYYGLTTWVDDTIGSFMSSLHKSGLADNTIIIFTADHGDMLGSHNRVQKGYLYEESIRIPFIINAPGIARNSVCSSHVANLVDIMPTLLSLAGIDQVSHTHGNDLTPILSGEQNIVNGGYSFIETGGDGIGIRTPTHIYGIPWSQMPGVLGSKPHYFYNLVQDPYQLNNLANTDTESDIANKLDGLLRNWNGNTPGMDS